jgi:hypothetical protein
MAVLEIGAEALHWLKTGTWQGIETIRETWPSAAAYVKTTEWIFMKDIGLWVIAKSVSFAYLGLGDCVSSDLLFFMQLCERMETATRIRHRSDCDW